MSTLTLLRHLLFHLAVIGTVLALSACEDQSPPPTLIDGIECDAECQARRNTSGTGEFPALDTKVRPRKPPEAPAPR
jgi:hypothetical protein